MSNMEQMKVLVEERLTAAVEEIRGIIENVIQYYEEKDSRSKLEIERQNRLLDILLKPKITLQRADTPQLSVWKQEVPPEQQERSPGLDQEDPEPPQIKEEQEETCTSQEGEQFQGLEEADTKDSIYIVTCVRNLYDHHQSQSPHLNQTVENREGEPLPSTSTEQMETEADGEGCGDSEPTSDCQPLSSDHSVAESEDTDRNEDRMEGGGPQSGLKTKRSKTVKRLRSGISSEGKKSMESSDLKSASKDAASCKVCGKSFTYYASFMKHVKTHAKFASHVCGVCGKHVESTESLVDHLRSHNIPLSKIPSKTYSCSICGKGFVTSSDLQRHTKTHTGERPYSCSVCEKGFITSSYLQNHMKTHTGERPYSCSVCGKGFIRRDRVQTHMKTHTGERPYTCSVCGKRFTHISALKKHMKTPRPYGGNVCGKRFIQPSNLNVHMKTHTGETLWSSDVC